MKKVPPPSETRWLFLRDSLNAILEQTRVVEAFLNINNNREKWLQHITSSDTPLGPIKNVPFSFQHSLVNAHFRLAKAILEILGDINEIFQRKYGFVHDFWEYMVPFYQLMKYELGKIENGDFTTYPFLGQLGQNEIPRFTTILKHLILNLNVRFFNVSFSLDKKKVRLFEL